MGKLLFFAIIIVLFYWILKDRFPAKNKEDDEETALLTDETEELVCCEYCGVHVQEDQSVAEDGKFFCSDEHVRQYLDSRP